ncbi:unnamed protein product [Bursaphelenchus xylophilus]|uniref:(pine wood nematode) hypothetical protein n=1 Tax=Bursaphelenchus xylophilus TaxID=6326 RepID=A0A1I7SUL6_BURXY|nr:unnamed protein product [Bursaphelenchus xylophilus]CAG9118594.1 unnamed protein product [Bursaphelenchus xylophilus]
MPQFMLVFYRAVVVLGVTSILALLLFNRSFVDDYVYQGSVRRPKELKVDHGSGKVLVTINPNDVINDHFKTIGGKTKRPDNELRLEDFKGHEGLVHRNLSKVEAMECRLPDLDPWNEKALYYINKGRDRMYGCVGTYTQGTFMKNGKVMLTAEEIGNSTQCLFRCYYPKDDYTFTYGHWQEISVEPDCDILEVNCTRKHDPLYNYNTLHTQIYRQYHYFQTKPTAKPPTSTTPPDLLDVKKPHSDTPPNPKPDVHMIIFDSVSTTQFMRSMPATVHVLREEMEAVVMPNVNKVGINSRPNGYALLMGRQAYEMEKSPINDERKPKINMYDMCGYYLEQDQFIGYEFKKKGYTTLFSEDWELGVFNWPNCFGFGKTPVDHYMRPFQLRLESKKYRDENATMKNHLYWEMCREAHEYQMDYLKDFIDVYPDIPKFSITWFTYLAHDDANGLFHVDLYFKRFFRNYKKKLSNSFLFVMGDHGYRFGGIRRTKTGEAEDKNPLLMVVVPEHLRGNDNLIKNMRENGKHLTTHYDTFATMVDIAYNAPNWNKETVFNGMNKTNIPVRLEGESYLHPFKLDKPRNCNNQRVPFDFCNCQLKQVDRSNETEFGYRIAQFMVDKMNQALTFHNHTHLCSTLELNKKLPIEVEEFEPELRFNAFKVTFKVLPGEGHLWGFVQMHGENRDDKNAKFSLISERLARLDEYEPTAFCSSSPYVKPYCYCKEIFSMTSSTTTTSKPPKS